MTPFITNKSSYCNFHLMHCIIFLLFLSARIITPQTISSVEVRGSTIFSIDTYNNWINISSGSKFYKSILDSVQLRIEKQLKNRGYYNSDIQTNIEKTDSSQIKILITVKENEQTEIRNIEFVVDSIDSIHVASFTKSLIGKVFAIPNVEFTINEILGYYENSGFPFASVNISSVYFCNDTLSINKYADFILQINKNRYCKIDRIEVIGNSKTSENVITRAIGIKAGEIYKQEKIDRIANRLNRLRFFEPVEEPQYFFNSKDEGVLKISVAEKITNNFDGVVGFVPGSNNNEKGYFNGYLSVSLRNLFGSGRAINFRWFQENKFSQELEIKYLEPWFFNIPININFQLFQRKQDSTYVQRTLEGNIEYILDEDISASLIFNSQSTIPTERVNKIFTVFNSSVLTSGLNLKIDTRDDLYSPTQGLFFINTYKYSSKKINGPKEYILTTNKTDKNFQRYEIDFGYYKKIFLEQIIALTIHARELRGTDFEISDIYFLGGTNSLRGYREKQFMGNRILWSNFEYRYLLSNRSFAFIFFDTGYFLRNEDLTHNIQKISEFKIGYGLGMNIETSLGVFGISFALGEGDSFSSGKFHFGIVNEF